MILKMQLYILRSYENQGTDIACYEIWKYSCKNTCLKTHRDNAAAYTSRANISAWFYYDNLLRTYHNDKLLVKISL